MIEATFLKRYRIRKFQLLTVAIIGALFLWMLGISAAKSQDVPYLISPSGKQDFQGHAQRGIKFGFLGVDYDLRQGTEIFSTFPGVIYSIEERPNQAGTAVWQDHGCGFISFYTHLDGDEIVVQIGDFVDQGELISKAGNTHFHYGFGRLASGDGPPRRRPTLWLDPDQLGVGGGEMKFATTEKRLPSDCLETKSYAAFVQWLRDESGMPLKNAEVRNILRPAMSGQFGPTQQEVRERYLPIIFLNGQPATPDSSSAFTRNTVELALPFKW